MRTTTPRGGRRTVSTAAAAPFIARRNRSSGAMGTPSHRELPGRGGPRPSGAGVGAHRDEDEQGGQHQRPLTYQQPEVGDRREGGGVEDDQDPAVEQERRRPGPDEG